MLIGFGLLVIYPEDENVAALNLNLCDVEKTKIFPLVRASNWSSVRNSTVPHVKR